MPHEKQEKQVKEPKSSHENLFGQILSVLGGSREREGADGIYCPAGSGFTLDKLTDEEERQFREALGKTKLSLISIPIGKKKKRFKDLFRDGKVIESVVKDSGRSILYIPPKTFQMAYCKRGNTPSYIYVVK